MSKLVLQTNHSEQGTQTSGPHTQTCQLSPLRGILPLNFHFWAYTICVLAQQEATTYENDPMFT